MYEALPESPAEDYSVIVVLFSTNTYKLWSIDKSLFIVLEHAPRTLQSTNNLLNSLVINCYEKLQTMHPDVAAETDLGI